MTDSLSVARQFAKMNFQSRIGTYNPTGIKFDNNTGNTYQIQMKTSSDKSINLFNFSDNKEKKQLLHKMFNNIYENEFFVPNALSFSWLLTLQGKSIKTLFNAIPEIDVYLKHNKEHNKEHIFEFLFQVAIAKVTHNDKLIQTLINKSSNELIKIIQQFDIFIRIGGGFDRDINLKPIIRTKKDTFMIFQRAINTIIYNGRTFLKSCIEDIDSANIFMNKSIYEAGYDGYISELQHAHEIAIFDKYFLNNISISRL